MKRVPLLAAATLAAGILVAPGPASADTENCASVAEYDRLEVLMSPGSVERLFDIPGYFLGELDNGNYKRGYKTCWNPTERRIVIWYDGDSSLSIRWDIRDIG